MNEINCKSLLEGVLFQADTPLSLERLAAILEEFDRNDIVRALNDLRTDYDHPHRGIALVEVAGGFQLRTRPEHSHVIRRLQKSRATKFSQSAMETLAIIAYRQPVTRVEIEYLRGVDCGGVVKTLLDKKLIRILGKKDLPGRPIVYGTTREFLEAFNLKSLSGLPTIKEIQDLDLVPLYEDQAELPLDPSRSAPFEQPLLGEEPDS